MSSFVHQLHHLVHLELREREASAFAREIARHRVRLMRRLGRDPGEPVAVLDYFLNVRPHFTAPKIVELAEFRSIERDAISDRITGLFNRSYIESVVEREVQRVRRYRTHSALLLLDLDGLKALNDRLGHEAGDEALRCVGAAIRRNLRAVDVPGRYGGDEFVVLLPGATRADAVLAGERIRGDMVMTGFAGLTISGGAVSLQGEKATTELVLAAADAALYEAKRAGRNRIVERA